MTNLTCFLSENAAKIENLKLVVSKRFVNKGKPVEWEIRAISSEEDEQLRKSCTKRVPVSGKRNQFTQELDFETYIGKIAAMCTIFPNLNDKELQDSYNAMSGDVLLKRMLTPGEYAEYLSKIQELNGFDIDFNDKVDEAKN